MDILNLKLKEAFRPEVWQALQQSFIEEFLSESAAKYRSNSSPALTVRPPVNPVPALLRPVRSPLTQNKRERPGGRRVQKYPPPLDPSGLAYRPPQVRGARWSNETAIGLRHNFIGEALKKAGPAGASEEEIFEHLLTARFPVEDEYYGEMVSGKPRIYSSVLNDLAMFVKRGWARKLARDRWRWVR